MPAPIIARTKMKAPRICVYGQHGIGKSSLGASAPSPLFIDVEGGLDALGVEATERVKDFQDVLDTVEWLTTGEHHYKTLVIDTLDWLEDRIYADVCMQTGKSDIAEVGFGRGYVAARLRWQRLMKSLELLRDERNMIVILNCHARITEFKDPERENYDVYTLDLYQGKNVDTVNMVAEWCDIVAFINYKIVAQKSESTNDKAKAKGSGQRAMFFKPRPSFLAKCRYSGFPDSLDYVEGEGWSAIAKELKKFRASQQTSTSEAGNLSIAKEQHAATKEKQRTEN